MKFGIVIKFERCYIRLQVERTYVSNEIEKFEVLARNKSLTFQTNRPLLKAKGLKARKPDYKLLSGSVRNVSLLQNIIDTLHAHLKETDG